MAATGPLTQIDAPGIRIEGDLLYSMRNEVAELLKRRNTNFPGAQPVSFARRHLAELTKTEWVDSNVKGLHS
jgi:mRNA guanylyltransferase